MQGAPIPVDANVRDAKLSIKRADPCRPLVKIASIVDGFVEDAPEEHIPAAKIHLVHGCTRSSKVASKKLEKTALRPLQKKERTPLKRKTRIQSLLGSAIAVFA